MPKNILALPKPKGFKHFLMISKIIGIFACTITNDRLKSAKELDHFYCILWIMFHITYTSILFHGTMRQKFPMGERYKSIRFASFTLRVVFIIAFEIAAIAKERPILKFFNKLETYDDKAKTLRHPRIDNFAVLWVFALIVIIIFGMMLPCAWQAQDTSASVELLIIKYTVPMVMQTCCVFFYGTLVYLLLQRLRHLKKLVIFGDITYGPKKPGHKILVNGVRSMYDILFAATQELNDAYGAVILVFCLSCTVNLLVTVYGFILYETVVSLRFLLITILQIVCLFGVCHFTSKQARQVVSWITDYEITFCRSLDTMEKIETMLYYYNKPLFFTAANFFNIDLSLILLITAALSTYLVIIIQM